MNKKIKMKINRYVAHIGEDDLILDNGGCIQVITQQIAYSNGTYGSLIMSKKLFNELKKLDFIYPDVSLTRKANKDYNKEWLFYFRFDIDKMIAGGGYKVVELYDD